ncbi:hypothetical protein K6982_01605 [Xanthomonas cucurbitae]|uniref:hypothetical protein n=1 Tax=Xanthomonas cucurbitae TaxID=56453 RepID=UPI002799C245|nr:hypothetical protein K6982_01605 [Xanthomonas cucurbitae]
MQVDLSSGKAGLPPERAGPTHGDPGADVFKRRRTTTNPMLGLAFNEVKWRYFNNP